MLTLLFDSCGIQTYTQDRQTEWWVREKEVREERGRSQGSRVQKKKGDTNVEVEGGCGEVLKINRNVGRTNEGSEESKCKEYRGTDKHFSRSTAHPYYTNTADLSREAK